MIMRRSFFAAGVALLLLCGSGVSQAQDSAGTIGIRIIDAPSSRSDDPRAKLYIVDHVAPGSTISRRLEVRNDTNAAQRIETYAGAASVESGEFRFGEDRAVNELTTWTTVDPSSDTYAVGEKRFVRVTIVVPEDASESERYAVIWASVSSAAPTGGGISAVNRVGVRVYLSVGPGGEPPSSFSIERMRAARTAAGEPQVLATVKNTGGRALDLSGELALDDGPGGLSAGPFPVKVGTTLGIGDTGPVSVTLDKALPAGPWKSTLTLESGLTKERATATLRFPERGSAPAVDTRSDDGTNVAVIAVPAVAVAALALLFFVRRARRPRSGAVEPLP